MVTLGWYVLLQCFLVSMVTVSYTAGDRVGAKYKYIPACHRDAQYMNSWTSYLYRCNNPMYTTCWYWNNVHICCGPNQYCCPHLRGCCRIESWTAYEKAAVATGAAAWLGILIVLGICLGPTVWRQIRRRCCKSGKVYPQMKPG